MFPWLDRSETESYVGDFANNFNEEVELARFAKTTSTGWLKSLIGSAKVDELKGLLSQMRDANNGGTSIPGFITEENEGYIELVKPFMAYACWCDYIALGNLKNSKSGLVKKVSAGEVQLLSKEDQATAYGHYMALAKRSALDLADYHKKLTSRAVSCAGSNQPVGNGRPSATIIRAKNNSIFN